MAFLDPDIIESVIPWVQEKIRYCYDTIDSDEYDSFDPNDVMIFESFILPELVEHRLSGIESDNLLQKWYGFIVANIATIIQSREQMSNETRGKLIRIWYEWECGKLLSYIHGIPSDVSLLKSQKYITFMIDQLHRLNTIHHGDSYNGIE